MRDPDVAYFFDRMRPYFQGKTSAESIVRAIDQTVLPPDADPRLVELRRAWARMRTDRYRHALAAHYAATGVIPRPIVDEFGELARLAAEVIGSHVILQLLDDRTRPRWRMTLELQHERIDSLDADAHVAFQRARRARRRRRRRARALHHVMEAHNGQ